MKKFAIILTALLLLTACSPFSVYQLGELLPPLYNTETQDAYVEKIVVSDPGTGASAEITELFELEQIIAQFAEISCTRKKLSAAVAEPSPLYDVTFITVDGDIKLSVMSETSFIIDGYVYESVAYSADLLLFEDIVSP